MLLVLMQDPCLLEANKLVGSDYFYQECLRQFPFNATVRDATLDSLLSLNEIFVFKEAAKHENEYGVPPVDIEAGLRSLQKQTFDSDFDFHCNVTALYERLKDAHTKYRAPQGYQQLVYFLPVYPHYDVVSGKFYLRKIDTPAYKELSEAYFAAHPEQIPAIGAEIAEFNGKPALEGFVALADELVGKSKEQNARFNELLRQAFFARPIGRYNFSRSEQVHFKLMTGDAETEMDFPMQLYAKINVSTEIIYYKNKQAAYALPRFDTVDENLRISRVSRQYNAETGEYIGKDMRLVTYTENNEISGFLLEIRSFSPDNVTEFVDDFYKICSIMDEAYGDDLKLVVSLLYNGGGYITLGFRSLAVLAPFIQPRYGQYSIQKSPLNEFFTYSTDKHNLFSTQTRYNYSSYEIYSNQQWFAGETQAEHDVQTGTYSFDLAYDEVPASDYERLVNTKTPHWLDSPENNRIAFVTDGLCGSTCACFITRAKEARAGLFLAVGGIPDERRYKTAIASFPGGSVMRSDYTDLFNLSQYGVKPFPLTSYAGWAHEQLYSWRDGALRAVEYVHESVDDVIDVWPDADAHWLEKAVLDDIYAQSLEKLRTGVYNFWITTEGCEMRDHAFYGKNSSSTECYAFACDKGYKLTGDVCEKVPDVHYHTTGEMSTGMQIFVCVGVTVVGAVLIGIVAFFYAMNKKEYQKLRTHE